MMMRTTKKVEKRTAVNIELLSYSTLDTRKIYREA